MTVKTDWLGCVSFSVHLKKNWFFRFSDQFLMIIGGSGKTNDCEKVELVSLDLLNNPVPARLENLGRFPMCTTTFDSAGAMTKSGMHLHSEAKLYSSVHVWSITQLFVFHR